MAAGCSSTHLAVVYTPPSSVQLWCGQLLPNSNMVEHMSTQLATISYLSLEIWCNAPDAHMPLAVATLALGYKVFSMKPRIQSPLQNFTSICYATLMKISITTIIIIIIIIIIIRS